MSIRKPQGTKEAEANYKCVRGTAFYDIYVTIKCAYIVHMFTCMYSYSTRLLQPGDNLCFRLLVIFPLGLVTCAFPFYF